MSYQVYYHFLSYNHAIDDLEKQRIKVALINELNDPFELLPNLRFSFRKRQLYHDVRRKLSKKYGLLCLTKGWGEPLLWSHYANKHKGVAIGFRVLKDEITRVSYPKLKRPKVELTNKPDLNQKMFLNLAKTKYAKWSYESEHRIAVELTDCDPGTGKDKGKYFLNFSGRLEVDGIVLGDKVNKEDRRTIKRLAERVGATNFIASRLSWEDYKVQEDRTKTEELKTF
jgi:hypothetical protein